jgi:hypothetical protein
MEDQLKRKAEPISDFLEAGNSGVTSVERKDERNWRI